MNEVKIKVNHDGNGSLEINGTDVSGAVRGFEIRSEIGNPTQMQVFLVPGARVIEAETRLTVDPATAAVLKAAGWRSPQEVADPLGLTEDQRAASQVNETIDKIGQWQPDWRVR